MNQETPVFVALSAQEVLQLEILLTDQDTEEAFAFLRALLQKIQAHTRGGVKPHLDR
jgi:hypothetical protein